MVRELHEHGCHVALTFECLSISDTIDRVRSPKAGAIVLFAGTTRDSFQGKEVKELEYTSYEPLALQTMLNICKATREKYSLTAIAIIHRLGKVPIGEESILITASSPHRQAAWRAGEEALEECKAKVEVWKWEEMADENASSWRANQDAVDPEKVGVSHNDE